MSRSLKHTFFYAVLSLAAFMISYPNMQIGWTVGEPPEVLGSHSLFLNEPILKNSSLLAFNPVAAPLNASKLYGWVPFGDHHIMGNLYRAVKTGEPFSNLGYNTEWRDPLQSGPAAVSNMKFKGLYVSAFNNSAELIYNFLPEELHSIDTPEKELKVAHYVTLFRLSILIAHIIGYIYLFWAIFTCLGAIPAWVMGVMMILNPLPLNTTQIGQLAPVALMFYFAFVLHWYPKVLKNFSLKKYLLFAVVFALLCLPILWFNYMNFIIQTWSFVMVFIFFLEGIFMKKDAIKKMKPWVMVGARLLGIATTLLIFFAPIYFMEVRQVMQWTGLDYLELSVKRLSDTAPTHFLGPSIFSAAVVILKNMLKQLWTSSFFCPILYYPSPFFIRFTDFTRFLTGLWILFGGILLWKTILIYKKEKFAYIREFFIMSAFGFFCIAVWWIAYWVMFTWIALHGSFWATTSLYYQIPINILIGVMISTILKKQPS